MFSLCSVYTFRYTDMSGSLAAHVFLRDLCLDSNKLGIDGALALAEGLHAHHNLRSLSVSRNALGPDGVIHLVTSAMALRLARLDISRNEIGSMRSKAGKAGGGGRGSDWLCAQCSTVNFARRYSV